MKEKLYEMKLMIWILMATKIYPYDNYLTDEENIKIMTLKKN